MHPTRFVLLLAFTFAHGKSLFPDFGQHEIQFKQFGAAAPTAILQSMSGAGKMPPFVCKYGECHVCWESGGQVCVTATAIPGRIHLLLKVNDTTVVEGDVFGDQSICSSYQSVKVCLTANEVVIASYHACLFGSVQTDEELIILRIGCFTIPKADIAKDVAAMFLRYDMNESLQ